MILKPEIRRDKGEQRKTLSFSREAWWHLTSFFYPPDVLCSLVNNLLHWGFLTVGSWAVTLKQWSELAFGSGSWEIRLVWSSDNQPFGIRHLCVSLVNIAASMSSYSVVFQIRKCSLGKLKYLRISIYNHSVALSRISERLHRTSSKCPF